MSSPVPSAELAPGVGKALVMRGLVKQFGATRALDEASLDIEAGSVHGLVGQNGAGKSTLIKVLAGLVSPDAGSVTFFGRDIAGITPAGATEAGIAFIHQDRLLVPTATVGEALFLGREASASRFGVWSRTPDRRAREALMHYFGMTLPRGALIRDLVWTAPTVQVKCDAARSVCSHVSGL